MVAVMVASKGADELYDVKYILPRA